MIPEHYFTVYASPTMKFNSAYGQVNRMLFQSVMVKMLVMKGQGNLFQFKYGPGATPITVQLLP